MAHCESTDRSYSSLCLFPSNPAADVVVAGRISHQSAATPCLLQLRKPIWELAADDLEVSGSFTARFADVAVDETVIVNLTCGGYQAYSSRPLHLDEDRNLVDIGAVDARTRMDSDNCRELTGAEGQRTSKELLAAFRVENHLDSSTLKLSRPRSCPGRTIMFVVYQGNGADPWDNWLVTKVQATGQITMEKGF